MPLLPVAGLPTHYAHRRPVPASWPPVLFVHGAGGSHQHWLHQVRDLPHSSSYAPDLPGHGRSQGAGRDSIASYGDWLITFLDTLGLERAVWVGHSMGGAIALDAALRYPARVAGLGLIATGARLGVAPAILNGIRQDSKAAVRLVCDLAFGPEAPPEMVRLGRRQMGMVPDEVLYGDFTACNTFDVTGRLAEIRSKAFVLCGTHDRLTPAKYSIYLQKQMAGAKLHLVEGTGHMVMVEKPKAVLQAIRSLLDAL